VGESGTLTWHDHRMHYMATGTPPQVKDEGKRTKVFDYEIPLRSTAQGRHRGDPLLDRSRRHFQTPFLIVGALGLLASGAALVRSRRTV
jgi:hypothetical protein